MQPLLCVALSLAHTQHAAQRLRNNCSLPSLAFFKVVVFQVTI